MKDVFTRLSPKVAADELKGGEGIDSVVAVCADGRRVYALDIGIGMFVIEPFRTSR